MLVRLLATILMISLGNFATAQSAFPTVFPAPVLLLDRDRLFSESKLGQVILAAEAETRAALTIISRDIKTGFENEESRLTDLRATIAAEEFQILSDDFDQRVQAMREEQLAEDIALQQKSEQNRRRFFSISAPYMSEIMQRYQASAILDIRTVLLFNKDMDITAEAIALLDIAYTENPDIANEEQ